MFKDRKKNNTKLLYKLMEAIGGNELKPGSIYEFRARFMARRAGGKRKVLKVSLVKLIDGDKLKKIVPMKKKGNGRAAEKIDLH